MCWVFCFAFFAGHRGAVWLLGRLLSNLLKKERQNERRQTGEELSDYKWGETADTEREVSEVQGEQEHRFILWDSSVLTGPTTCCKRGRKESKGGRGVRPQQRWGFKWDNMGPWRGNAYSVGIRGEREVLENMREILRRCRWPRHVFITQWIST